jgi:type II secretion system protein J
MRRRRPISRTRRGFTLLELLIATVVGGIVLLVVQTAFFGALRLHDTTHARHADDLALDRALGLIRRDLAGLMLPGNVLAGHLQTTTFSSSVTDAFGERVSPDFYTNSGRIDGWNAFADVQRVAYFLADPADRDRPGKDLVRVVNRNLLPVQEEPGDPQTILTGVAEASVEFFDGVGWTAEWDSEVSESLPTALKFRFVLADANVRAGSAPYEVIVPVLVTTGATAAAQAAEASAAGEL